MRSQFLLELTLAKGSASDASYDLTWFRAALQMLAQETRFQIFNLVSTCPNQLTLDDICERIGGSRDKFYNHLYQMLRVGLIISVQAPDGRRSFTSNMAFVAFGFRYFRSRIDHAQDFSS